MPTLQTFKSSAPETDLLYLKNFQCLFLFHTYFKVARWISILSNFNSLKFNLWNARYIKSSSQQIVYTAIAEKNLIINWRRFISVVNDIYMPGRRAMLPRFSSVLGGRRVGVQGAHSTDCALIALRLTLVQTGHQDYVVNQWSESDYKESLDEYWKFWNKIPSCYIRYLNFEMDQFMSCNSCQSTLIQNISIRIAEEFFLELRKLINFVLKTMFF